MTSTIIEQMNTKNLVNMASNVRVLDNENEVDFKIGNTWYVVRYDMGADLYNVLIINHKISKPTIEENGLDTEQTIDMICRNVESV